MPIQVVGLIPMVGCTNGGLAPLTAVSQSSLCYTRLLCCIYNFPVARSQKDRMETLNSLLKKLINLHRLGWPQTQRLICFSAGTKGVGYHIQQVHCFLKTHSKGKNKTE